MKSKDVTTSPIKWAGSKRRLLPDLLARLPKKFGRYYEPFAGGASLFFRLAPDHAVLGDINADLIATYRALAAEPEKIIRRLRHHERAYSAGAAQTYYQLRDEWNANRSSWTPARSAAALITLNKCGYNGLWRVNRRGEFNVPMGRYDDPAICVPDALRAAHTMLRRAELRSGDYRTTLSDVEPGDLCYLDPPYMPVSKTASFTSYSAVGFGPEHQRELAETARQLVARGCHVVLSNSDSRFIRSLYREFSIDAVKCSRSINSAVTRRGEVDELIIVGRPRIRPPRSPQSSSLGKSRPPRA